MPWFPLLAGLTLWVSAGTLEWWPGRYCFRAVGLAWLISVLFLAMKRPDLLKRRRSAPPASALPESGVPAWDTHLLRLLRLGLLLLLAVAGWQSGRARLPVEPALFGAGLILLGLGTMLLLACLAANPFFETEVRHQSEQGQHVIHSGPYRWLRHPGYAALILMLGSLPGMLHSSLSVFPWLFCVLVLGARLKREEVFLSQHLMEYAAYQEQVRYRLLPWIW